MTTASRNKQLAAERRTAFAKRVPELLSSAGLPTEDLDSPGFALPKWAVFTADRATLVVTVAEGESWRTVEKAMAYGVAHLRGRRLALLLPSEVDNGIQATRIRAAFLEPKIEVWAYDAGAATRMAPLSQAEAQKHLTEKSLRGGVHDLKTDEPLVRSLLDWADGHPQLSAAHRQSYLRLALRRTHAPQRPPHTPGSGNSLRRALLRLGAGDEATGGAHAQWTRAPAGRAARHHGASPARGGGPAGREGLRTQGTSHAGGDGGRSRRTRMAGRSTAAARVPRAATRWRYGLHRFPARRRHGCPAHRRNQDR